MSINASNSSRRKGNSNPSHSNGSSKSHSWRNSKSGGQKQQHSNKFQTSSPGASKSNSEVAGAASPVKQDQGTLGLFWAVSRLLVILAKGLVAVVIIVVLFNLALVVINKTLLGGKLGQYIDTPSWKDILGTHVH